MGGEKPSPYHTVDRIDVNGHYEPGNVRWATWKEQNGNKVKKPSSPRPKPKKKAKVKKEKTIPASQQALAESDDPDERGLALLLTKVNKAQIAAHLGIKKQNLTRWKAVPPKYVAQLSELTQLPREYILPSVFA
jgi:hypothetical protein